LRGRGARSDGATQNDCRANGAKTSHLQSLHDTMSHSSSTVLLLDEAQFVPHSVTRL
jgi:hypothetical protein